MKKEINKIFHWKIKNNRKCPALLINLRVLGSDSWRNVNECIGPYSRRGNKNACDSVKHCAGEENVGFIWKKLLGQKKGWNFVLWKQEGAFLRPCLGRGVFCMIKARTVHGAESIFGRCWKISNNFYNSTTSIVRIVLLTTESNKDYKIRRNLPFYFVKFLPQKNAGQGTLFGGTL